MLQGTKEHIVFEQCCWIQLSSEFLIGIVVNYISLMSLAITSGFVLLISVPS